MIKPLVTNDSVIVSALGFPSYLLPALQNGTAGKCSADPAKRKLQLLPPEPAKRAEKGTGPQYTRLMRTLGKKVGSLKTVTIENGALHILCVVYYCRI